MTTSFTRKDFIVPEGQPAIRIDHFLATVISDLSRRKIRQILDVGGCYVNNKRMHIASRSVKSGDRIRVEYSLEGLKKTRQRKFCLQDADILYDANGLIAINKPPGLPSQATRDQDVMHAETCLREWLTSHGRKNVKLILVHRLDKETSGVLLFATNPNVATWMTDQFRTRMIKKTYWALCKGLPKSKKFKVECYLSEIDKKTGKVTSVHSGGKTSRTDFVERQRSESLNLSWVECYPETGRSHQIRVHLEMSKIPILGDKKYGRDVGGHIDEKILEVATLHHMLHARKLEFVPSPGEKHVQLVADPPQDFVRIMLMLEPS
jgi:RluA family pseudouridine synthase